MVVPVAATHSVSGIVLGAYQHSNWKGNVMFPLYR